MVAEHPIVALRRREGLTIKQLAAASGISVGAISYIEAGATRNPNQPTLDALAVPLGVKVSDLELALAQFKVAQAEE